MRYWLYEKPHIQTADRDHFVLATKYVCSARRGDPNASGAHRKNLVQSLDASLRRLGTDRIDLYWVHLWDFLTSTEEVMRALDDQVQAGKILYIGIRSMSPVLPRAIMMRHVRRHDWDRIKVDGTSR
jgi:aryl-alcohol dehydrogenase-like predicted oxidoreductase